MKTTSAQQGEIVVTKTAAGQIVAVTRQDEEGQILEVIAEASTQREQPIAGLCTATDEDDGVVTLHFDSEESAQAFMRVYAPSVEGGTDAALSSKREQPAASKPAECKCSMRTKLVGDGCAVCNPELAEELSKPEPQAQAGEPATVQFHDHPDLVGGVKWSELELKWIEKRDQRWRQYHREAMAEARSYVEFLDAAIAKKDAALKAYEKSSECAKSALSEAIMIAPLTHVPPSAGAAIQELDAAITQGQSALQ